MPKYTKKSLKSMKKAAQKINFSKNNFLRKAPKFFKFSGWLRQQIAGDPFPKGEIKKKLLITLLGKFNLLTAGKYEKTAKKRNFSRNFDDFLVTRSENGL